MSGLARSLVQAPPGVHPESQEVGLRIVANFAELVRGDRTARLAALSGAYS